MYYTPKEVGLMLKVNYRKILEIIIMGNLPAFKIGRQYRISHECLMEYLQNSQVESANF